jgi:hypothetical protein
VIIGDVIVGDVIIGGTRRILFENAHAVPFLKCAALRRHGGYWRSRTTPRPTAVRAR